jgi:hypothetical protein
VRDLTRQGDLREFKFLKTTVRGVIGESNTSKKISEITMENNKKLSQDKLPKSDDKVTSLMNKTPVKSRVKGEGGITRPRNSSKKKQLKSKGKPIIEQFETLYTGIKQRGLLATDRGRTSSALPGLHYYCSTTKPKKTETESGQWESRDQQESGPVANRGREGWNWSRDLKNGGKFL